MANVHGDQASLFPLLAADDDVTDRYSRHNHHPHNNYIPTHDPNNVNSNVSNSNHFSSKIGFVAAAPAREAAVKGQAAAAAAAPTPTSNRPLGPGAVNASTSIARDSPVSFSFRSKLKHQREQRIGPPLRAHLTSPPTVDGGTSGGGRTVSPSGATDASSGGLVRAPGDGTGGNGRGSGGTQKSLTPRSFALGTEPGAKLAIGRAPPAPNSANPSTRFGGGSPSQGSSYSRPLSTSSNRRPASSPRTFSPDAAHGSNYSYGAVAPPHGGQGMTVVDSWDKTGSNGNNHNGGVCYSGSGRGGGSGAKRGAGADSQYYHNHVSLQSEKHDTGGVSRCSTPETSASSPIPSSPITNGSPRGGGVGKYRPDSTAASGGVGLGADTKQQHARRMRGIDGWGVADAATGTPLAGPEGAVEVREIDGGVLVVRRSGDEKKRSPERLNLHRRQLSSCPLVQV